MTPELQRAIEQATPLNGDLGTGHSHVYCAVISGGVQRYENVNNATTDQLARLIERAESWWRHIANGHEFTAASSQWVRRNDNAIELAKRNADLWLAAAWRG